MKQRISAGMVIEDAGRLLMVRHIKPGVYDFWVAPGGGVEDTEDLAAAACREVFEETGLRAAATALVYIDQFRQPSRRKCKFWFTGRLPGRRGLRPNLAAAREGIVEAAFLTREELACRLVFPEVLRSDFWSDRKSGLASPRLLALRAMEFR